MAKTTKAFTDGLTIISLWGFVVIALLSFNITQIDLSVWQTTVLMIIAGGSLLLEGQILTANRWLRNGVQGNEVPMLMTLIVGLFSIIVGILAMPVRSGLPIFSSPQLQTVTGIVAVFSIIFIAAQRWIVD